MNDAVKMTRGGFRATGWGTAVLSGIAFGIVAVTSLVALGFESVPVAVIAGAMLGVAAGYCGFTASLAGSRRDPITSASILGFLPVVAADHSGTLTWSMIGVFLISGLTSFVVFLIRADTAS